MGIVNSEIISDSPQSDGRRHIRERHTESDGVFHDIVYMAEEGQNITSILPLRAIQIEASLMEKELRENEEEIIN